MDKEPLAHAMSDGVADIRRELIEIAWFGQAEPRSANHNHTSHEALLPDHDVEQGFLGWLRAEWPSAGRSERTDAASSLDPDADRERDAARPPDLSPDECGIDR